jgi:dihydrofolate synthase/folylpolyglutamate synthase
LLERFGNPQKGLPFLHVAGTNGKGSTATMLASVLQDAGYNVGCFTSPFIYDFRERFCINGQMISEQELTDLAQKVQRAELGLIEEGMEQATEFEIVAAIGFLYYRNCDVIVLEVGLGGRFDATNVIDAPLVSVICSISLDHTEYLGDTIEAIAYEKAGIIKDGCPVVGYNALPAEAISVLEEQCKIKNTSLTIGHPAEALPNNRFLYDGEEYELQLQGSHQINNAVTVLETLKLIRDQFPHSIENIRAGLKKAYIPARLECIHQNPFIFIDGGHNKEGIDALLKAIDTKKELADPVIIFAMMKDKPYQYAVQKLALRAKSFLTVQPELPRAMTAYDLKNMADLFCDDCVACDDFAHAAMLAKEKCKKSILVCGSLYQAGALAEELKKCIKAQ